MVKLLSSAGRRKALPPQQFPLPYAQTVLGGMAATSLVFYISKGHGSMTTSQSTTVYEPGLQPIPSILGLILLVN